MKKFLAALLIVLSLVACASAYTPGVYSAKARGNNAEIEVQVTFDEKAITDIKVVAHEETPGLGDKAFEKVIPAIISAQSTKVDGMTGATMSSNALKEAVEKCIAQASGTKSEVVSKFKPGEYKSTMTGHNGPLTVTMTFTEDKITSIKAEGVESIGIGTAAIDVLTKEILDIQSLACDSVSGATVTS